ncbi:c-di-GMP phosphodiesterase [Bacillus sp. UMB0899]|uniref:HD-GYP domain-containing protein n=1 Tax=Metabacillus schmidteae TaxID=2730405 RepID=UPI000C801FFB|nr:HD domain-containing protein [Metabacillus schmidteae]PMC33966.1 c-di-GMP phosphodiesterase [Bacillus sp. UMB0899]
MRFIDIEDYNPLTMQLAMPIYDRMRRVLLTAGRTIHPNYLERIKAIGVSTLVVEDAESTGITLEEMLDMPTWMDTIAVVQQAFEDASNKKRLNIVALQRAVVTLIREVSAHKTIILVPTTSLSEGLERYAHSVNVALLSLQISKHLGYTQGQLRDLALGALLHDIGKAVTDQEEEHPIKGFDIMKDNREISLLSAHIAYQHHECVNGQGYPRKLKGQAFLELPQVVGIANVYDHLLSNKKIPPHEALEYIMTKSDGDFSYKVVQAFVNSVPSYIPGTKVELYTGEQVIVIGIKKHLQRPVIRYVKNGEEMDLAENPSVMIKDVVKE